MTCNICYTFILNAVGPDSEMALISIGVAIVDFVNYFIAS